MDNREQTKQELFERYEQTGRIGFIRPENDAEALKYIDTIIHLYEDMNKKEEIVLSLSQITNKLRTFFDSYGF